MWGGEVKNGLTFASVRVVGLHVPVSVHARVTSAADDQPLTDTASGDEVMDYVRPALAFTAMLRPDWITITRYTHTHSRITHAVSY